MKFLSEDAFQELEGFAELDEFVPDALMEETALAQRLRFSSKRGELLANLEFEFE